MIPITHGQSIQLTANVRRITATNGGAMTGPGTNTYLVGSNEIAVIDPGPAEQAHIDAIIEACDGKLRWILATHTHPDHSPGAKALQEATGAQVMGNLLGANDGFQDDSFAPHHQFAHDECLSCDELTIRALHTPGHVGNHLCFLVEEDGLLLTGDHIMQGSTVVIIPPYGDMKDYIDSLQLMLGYPVQALGPGHGTLIEDPETEIRNLIAHRLGRESKVVAKLSQLGQTSLENLTPAVYDDVDPGLHPIAQYSLLAHLLKLQRDDRAEEKEGLWSMAEH